MRGTAGTENPPVTQEIKVKLYRVNHVGVDDRAGDAIATPVTLVLRTREEPNVVPLANDNKCDCGFYIQFCTRPCVDIRRGTKHGESGILRIRGSSSSRTVANCPSETPSEKLVCNEHAGIIEKRTAIEQNALRSLSRCASVLSQHILYPQLVTAFA